MIGKTLEVEKLLQAVAGDLRLDAEELFSGEDEAARRGLGATGLASRSTFWAAVRCSLQPFVNQSLEINPSIPQYLIQSLIPSDTALDGASTV